MLPKSRIISALLVGLGLALMVAGLSAPRFLNGDARFPLDLSNVTWTMRDPNGRVFTTDPDSEGGETVVAPVIRQLHLSVQNPATDELTGLRVGETLMRGDRGTEFDNLISASTWTYEMDRISGEFVTPAKLSDVMALPDTEVEAEGVWLKFPTNVQQDTYDVFEPVLRRPVPAEFAGEGTLDGRTVYTFVQEVEPTNVAREYNSPFNTITVGSPEGPVEAFRMHSATRTFTVDQITGVVLGIDERVDDYFVLRSAERVRDIVTYDATMDEAQMRDIAGQLTSVTQSISRTVTWTVIGLGAVLTVAGLVGALRPGRGRR